MNIYRVTFKYSEMTYCTNVALAENEEAVKEHYSKYNEVFVKDGSEYDLNEAQKKGMPIITIEAKQPEEAQADEQTTAKKEDATHA